MKRARFAVAVLAALVLVGFCSQTGAAPDPEGFHICGFGRVEPATGCPPLNGWPGGPATPPATDKLLFWDASLGIGHMATVGDGLTLTDTTLSATAATQTKYLFFTVLNPTAASDFPIGQFPRAITVTGIRALSVGGTSVVGCLDEYAGNGTALQAAIDGDWTAGTTELNDTSFTNAAIDAGDWLRWHTTSVTGAVSSVTVTLEYTETN